MNVRIPPGLFKSSNGHSPKAFLLSTASQVADPFVQEAFFPFLGETLCMPAAVICPFCIPLPPPTQAAFYKYIEYDSGPTEVADRFFPYLSAFLPVHGRTVDSALFFFRNSVR